MAPSDQEFGILRADVDTLKQDVCEMKIDVKKVLSYIEREEGAKAEREKLEQHQFKRMDMTWAKYGAVGCCAGAAFSAAQWAVHAATHLIP